MDGAVRRSAWQGTSGPDLLAEAAPGGSMSTLCTCVSSAPVQYDNPTRPIYMYINSTGVVVSGSPGAGQDAVLPGGPVRGCRHSWCLLGRSGTCPGIQPPPFSLQHAGARRCHTRAPRPPARHPPRPLPAEGQRQAGLRGRGVCHLRHHALHQAARGHGVRGVGLWRGRHAAGGGRAGAASRAALHIHHDPAAHAALHADAGEPPGTGGWGEWGGGGRRARAQGVPPLAADSLRLCLLAGWQRAQAAAPERVSYGCSVAWGLARCVRIAACQWAT